jgi:hypothetical protein
MALKHLQRHELVVLDELGYVPFSKAGAELLFQVATRPSTDVYSRRLYWQLKLLPRWERRQFAIICRVPKGSIADPPPGSALPYGSTGPACE